jgi:monomeric sarcosine oxidase
MPALEVLVVGGGVIGAATAYALARRGRRVLLLEQFTIGHARGSSHGLSRSISSVHSRLHHMRLVAAARQAWRRLEDDSGQRLLIKTGVLDIGHADSPAIQASIAHLGAVDEEVEILGLYELRARFPQLALTDKTIAIYQPEGGILPASRCVATMIEQARRYGARVATGVRVSRIKPEGSGVRVDADGTVYWAQRAVIAAGSYSSVLLRHLDVAVDLSTTCEQVAFFSPRHRVLSKLGYLPVVRDYGHHPGDHLLVCYPDLGEGIKVERHGAGIPVADPYEPPPIPDPAENERIAQRLAQIMPGFVTQVLYAETCRFTHTPDGDFVIDTHPEYNQILIAIPGSSCGFSVAPIVGEILSDLAMHGTTSYDIAPFRLARLHRIGRMS